MESLYGQQRMPVENDTGISEMLIKPEWRSDILVVREPITIDKEVYVIIPNLFAPDGEPIYERRKVQVYKGVTSKEIKLPIPNLFTPDLASAMLGNDDVTLINDLINLFAYTMQLSFATGEDYSTDLYKLHNVIGAVLNTSGARGGRKAELAKTQITKGESKSWFYQQQLEKEKKRKKFLIF